LHPRTPGAGGRHLDTSLSGVREARELDRLMIELGKPKMLVSDNGSELTSNAILTWADQTRVDWHYIAPGKPLKNAFIESLNALEGRIIERDAVHAAGPGSCYPLMLADRLQRLPTTPATWMEKTLPSSPSPSIRDGSWRCAMPRAPRQLLNPPKRTNPTVRANSDLDKNFGARSIGENKWGYTGSETDFRRY
jgi:putative transposase